MAVTTTQAIDFRNLNGHSGRISILGSDDDVKCWARRHELHTARDIQHIGNVALHDDLSLLSITVE